MKKPSEYLASGYNCAESIIKCYNEDFDKDIPLAIGSSLGGGACVGSLCGALNGSLVIIGYEKGRNNNSEINEARSYAKKFMDIAREKYSTFLCKELKVNKVSCAEITDFSYETLLKILEM